MKTKFLTSLVCVLTCISLVACGNTTATLSETENTVRSETTSANVASNNKTTKAETKANNTTVAETKAADKQDETANETKSEAANEPASETSYDAPAETPPSEPAETPYEPSSEPTPSEPEAPAETPYEPSLEPTPSEPEEPAHTHSYDTAVGYLADKRIEEHAGCPSCKVIYVDDSPTTMWWMLYSCSAIGYDFNDEYSFTDYCDDITNQFYCGPFRSLLPYLAKTGYADLNSIKPYENEHLGSYKVFRIYKIYHITKYKCDCGDYIDADEYREILDPVGYNPKPAGVPVLE